jgi:uncharacterized protein (DUF2252 family)
VTSLATTGIRRRIASNGIKRGVDVAAGLSLQDRIDRGKTLRKTVPLAAHAEWVAPADREDPVAILERQSATRLPELVPERYARMSESAFRFYRGAAALMAADLVSTASTGLRAQLCGDAHMLNFRLLASPERQLIFDVNDFDETLPGPWEWDMKRLAASLVIASRANGFGARTRRDIVVAAVASYREWIRRFASMPTLDVWYAQANAWVLEESAKSNLRKSERHGLANILNAARGRDNRQAVRKLTVETPGGRRIRSDPPLLVPVAELVGSSREAGDVETGLREILRRYTRTLPPDRRHLLEQYRLVDMARKVVGVGSVGTRCWMLLLVGRDEDDALLLQVKEASESVLAPFAGASVYLNAGQRVVTGQRLMQASSDIFLGWIRVEGVDGQTRDFYVRQLRDWKGIAVPEQLRPRDMRWFGTLAGATLARAHAKSSDRVAVASYLGRRDTFDRALGEFAEVYADQNEADAQLLLDAIASGRLTARHGAAPA